MIVGTYTAPKGEGLGIARLDASGAQRLAEVESPSFIAPHPSLPLLYTVAEFRGEFVVVDAATGAVLQTIEAGDAACHVRLTPDGRSAVVACWGDGRVLHYALGDDGLVASRTELPAASRPDAVSRAHASVAFGDGWISTDLGLDLVRVWRGLDEVQRLELPVGSGPRHVVVRGDLLYVDTEFTNEIVTIGRSGGALEVRGIAPARVGSTVDGDAAAEIALDPTGGWLTVGIRGSDVVASSRILPDGTTEPVAEAPTGGSWPRHHVHDGATILVANQLSSTITRLPFDPVTGAIGPVVETLPVGSPTHITLTG